MSAMNDPSPGRVRVDHKPVPVCQYVQDAVVRVTGTCSNPARRHRSDGLSVHGHGRDPAGGYDRRVRGRLARDHGGALCVVVRCAWLFDAGRIIVIEGVFRGTTAKTDRLNPSPSHPPYRPSPSIHRRSPRASGWSERSNPCRSSSSRPRGLSPNPRAPRDSIAHSPNWWCRPREGSTW